jgi:hypothetical protein
VLCCLSARVKPTEHRPVCVPLTFPIPCSLGRRLLCCGCSRRGCCPADVKLEGRRVQEWRRFTHRRTENRGARIRFSGLGFSNFWRRNRRRQGEVLVTSCERQLFCIGYERDAVVVMLLYVLSYKDYDECWHRGYVPRPPSHSAVQCVFLQSYVAIPRWRHTFVSLRTIIMWINSLSPCLRKFVKFAAWQPLNMVWYFGSRISITKLYYAWSIRVGAGTYT